MKIPKPGLYLDRGGKCADVKWVGDGRALGFDEYGDACDWNAVTGRYGPDNDTELCDYDIVGPMPPEPPDGFVVMPKDYVAKDGDVGRHNRNTEWGKIDEDGVWFGKTAEQLDTRWPEFAPYYFASPIPAPARPDPGEGWRLLEDEDSVTRADEFSRDGKQWERFDSEHIFIPGYSVREINRSRDYVTFFRRRIPAPFRISDHGEGVYETRDGRAATVERETGRMDYPWRGVSQLGNPVTWSDDGIQVIGEQNTCDLVRYLRPLPIEEPADLSRELAALLNKHSRENASNTPDFVLAEYLLSCLVAYEEAMSSRITWTRGGEEAVTVGGD